MTRYSAETLDLSRLAAPVAIRDIDYERILTERKGRLVLLLAAAGIAYDVQNLETDPAIIVEEADAYRELLAYARVNDAARSVMVAFAVGSDLDHMAASYGVTRILIAPATGSTPAIYENDTAFRRRVLLAPEAFAAAGPRGAYVYHALTSDPRVLNVDVWVTEPGSLTVAVQSREGDGTASDDLVSAVRAYLHRDDIKPLTDVVTVRSVVNHVFDVDLDAYVQPGPDTVTVQEAIVASVTRMIAERRTPARDMPRSAIISAAHIGVVDKVTLLSPAGDIARGYGEVPVLRDIDIRVSTYDG